jgi:hypothetical protein
MGVTHMNNKLGCAVLFAAVTMAMVSPSHAAVTVVTFDNLPDGVVPDGYGGINWNDNWTNYTEPQPPYTPESPPSRVYTISSAATFDFITPTVFDGAYFSGNSFAPVTFDLFNGATLVATSGTLAPSSTPTFLSSGYSGLVTEVVVSSPDPDFYVMDNVTFGVSGVPEPSTWAMMLLGFAVLGFAGYRQAAWKDSIALSAA